MRRLELKLILSLKAIGNLFCRYFFIFYFFLLVNGVAELEFKHFSELIHNMSLFFLYCSSESGTNDNDEDYEEPSTYYSDDDCPSDDDLYIK